MLQLMFFLCAALPIAWLVSEFQSRRWIRIVFGIAALSIVGLIAYGWTALLTTFTSNLEFSETTKTLLVAIDEGLASNDSERVQTDIRQFAKNYQPSYETSCVGEVKKFVVHLGAINSQTDPESGNGQDD
jgi:hypothetical protein